MKKKFMSILMILSVMLSTSVFANEEIITPQTEENKEIMLVSELKKDFPDFSYFEGQIKKISKTEAGLILNVTSEEKESNFVISNTTYIPNKEEYKVGQTVRGYFDNNLPMIMIYPAQYNIEALILINEKSNNVIVDTFNDELIDTINSLKLNISKDTKIYDESGKIYTGSLKNKQLFVEYEITTRSIPAQTNPVKIVVLKTANQEFLESIDYSKMNLLVGDKVINAGKAFNKDGIAMVELRSVIEALGLNISYDEKTKTVIAGKTTIKLPENSYSIGKMAPIKLEVAPLVIKGRTFVPLSYFKKVLQFNNAYSFENQIVINNYELME